MSGISNRLQTLSISGPAGNLEALLVEGRPGARYAALVCHPHPKGGGTMHNKVVYRAAKTMQSLGLATLRFNFRGTGLSEGEHDEGRGEQEDVRAALDWLHARYGLPVLVVGFSFGAYVSLRACCRDADSPGSDGRVSGFVALGLPVDAEGRGYSYDFLATCTLPKLFLSGGADAFGPAETLEQIVASAADPKTLVIVPDADHFFAGKLEQMQQALHGWLLSRFFPTQTPAALPLPDAMADEAQNLVTLHSLHQDARAIFAHALDACRIERVFDERVRCDGTTLAIEHSPHIQPPLPASRIDLGSSRPGSYHNVLIIALGKAAVPMTQSLLDILPRTVRVRGVCSAPARPARRDWRIRYYAGRHPLPNRESFRAAQRALRLLRRASDKTFVIYLISGGGSTLFDLPLDPEISLSDTIAFHHALIASGATIAEVNTLRKHFSAVKGGRLAAAAPRAAKLTLQVVDVPWHHADAVASGPTVADPSTVEDCRELLDRYQLLEKFPPSVRRFFSHPDLPETPGDKAAMKRDAERLEAARKAGPGPYSWASFSNGPAVTNWLATLLSNDDLLCAAHEKAVTLGYEVVMDSHCDDWPYDQAAAYLVDRLIALRDRQPGRKLCLLSGGEVTVRIDRKPGTGGRNQQFALACGLLLHQQLPREPVVCLSAGSDGVDGNSLAAGALADSTTILRAEALALDPEAALAAFDAGPLLAALGDSVITGPTGNNLRDLRILLSG